MCGRGLHHPILHPEGPVRRTRPDRRYAILKFFLQFDSHGASHLASTKRRAGVWCGVPHKCRMGNSQSQLQAGVNASCFVDVLEAAALLNTFVIQVRRSFPCDRLY